MKNKVLAALLLFVLSCTQIIGCGADNAPGQEGTSGGQSPSDSNAAPQYVAEEIALPHENIGTEAVSQNILYYVAAIPPENGETDSGASTIFRTDMEQTELAPEALPYHPEADQSISHMTVTDSGTIHLIVDKYDTVGQPVESLWVRLDESGNMTSSVSIQDITKGEYISHFITDDTGNAYLATGQTAMIIVLNPEGKLLFQTAPGNYITGLVRDKEGKIHVLWYGSQGGMDMAEVDLESQTMGAKQSLLWADNVVGTVVGDSGQMTIATTNGVYDYDPQQKNQTERFMWTDLDIFTNYYGQALFLADGRALWMEHKYLEDGTRASLNVIRPRRADEPVPTAKKVLTLGGLSSFIDDEIRSAVVAFNRSNPDDRIELVEYGAEDPNDGITQMDTAIAGGNCPDIILLPLGQISMNTYADKGILEDLSPLLDGDDRFNRSDLQENILKAFETDGKLYGIPIFYYLDTVGGRSSLLGNKSSWNLDEMIAFADRYLDEGQLFESESKARVLDICMRANMNSLIDRSDAENDFNRDFYMKALTFANRFQDNAGEVSAEEYLANIEEGITKLISSTVPGFFSAQSDAMMLGEPINYIGYPTENGGGSLVDSRMLLAISGKCEDKEAAWQFLGSMLTAEFQEENSETAYAFPLHKKALEKQMEKVMEVRYVTDENGNQVEQPTGMWSMGPGITRDLYAVKKEEAQVIMDLINSVTTGSRNYDEQIMNIISEEADAYFGGGKTAEEAADITENRIRLYMNEKS